MFFELFSGTLVWIPIVTGILVLSLLMWGGSLKSDARFQKFLKSLDQKVFGRFLTMVGQFIEITAGIISIKISGSVSSYGVFLVIGVLSLLSLIFFG